MLPIMVASAVLMAVVKVQCVVWTSLCGLRADAVVKSGLWLECPLWLKVGQ